MEIIEGATPTQEPAKEAYKLDIEKRITEAFEVFDHAGNKTVDVREVGTILRSLGCVPTEAEIQELIVNVEDQENSGSVHLDRFLPYVAGIINEYKLQPASAEDLLKAFHTLDPEGLGFISRDYMTCVLMDGREPFTQEEIDEMMDIAVDPRTGQINYELYINQIMVSKKDNIYNLLPPPDAMDETKLWQIPGLDEDPKPKKIKRFKKDDKEEITREIRETRLLSISSESFQLTSSNDD